MRQFAQALEIRQFLMWLGPLALLAVFWGFNAPRPSAPVAEVSIAEAKSMIDAGALVVDVRSQEAYGNRHLPGAILAPLSELRSSIPASLASAKDKPIVVYCNDGSSTGPDGTRVLNEAGFKAAVNLKSGIEGWQRSGLSIQTR